jgi:thioredoxin reductase (NADPH)
MSDQDTSIINTWNIPDFRPELAFAKFTDDMVARLRLYGSEEEFPANALLFTYGQRQIDMFVVLDGEVEVTLQAEQDGSKVLVRHVANDFTGELNLLNSQGSLVEGRTISPSRLVRVSRSELQRLMRAEGDIANLIASAAIWRRIGIMYEATSGVTLRGPGGDPETTELQRFLVRNSYPHRMVEATATEWNGPSIVLSDGRILQRPTIAELADELGITELPDPATIYDVAVVGAGPSGLAAAVYAASEGLCTTVIESIAPGGQAGTSSKIENYLGFPTGISGQRLASRAHLQALKFGVRFAISREIVSAEQIEGIHRLTLAGGIPVCARAVVIASGARYRKLSVENYSQYESRGIYYAATAMESMLCRENEVIVVGGGNSAGQAAVFFSNYAEQVNVLVRRAGLELTMSQYLIDQIAAKGNIRVEPYTQVIAAEGDDHLEQIVTRRTLPGEMEQVETRAADALFVMIGADASTKWLPKALERDAKGYICTGRDLKTWKLEREPFPLETNLPGIFCAGDVRHDSIKRVSSGVGEGSMAIAFIHQYLALQNF